MGEAVDLLAGEMAGGQHEILVLGLLSQPVGHGQTIEAGPDDGMVGVIVDPIPEEVDLEVQVGDALYVLLGGLQPRAHRATLLGSQFAIRAASARSATLDGRTAAWV